MKHRIFWICLALFTLAAGGWRLAADESPAAGKTYEAHGVVREIAADRTAVTIQHDAITGYMPAMTMEFPVKDTNELRGLAPSDEINFKLVVRENGDWIQGVQFVAHRIENVTNGIVLVHAPVAELQPGDRLPDYEFTDEHGGRIRISDFRGRVLAFTFFFTRCPLPDYCPRMSKDFAEARQLLLKTPNTPTNWQFLSVSFDPAIDQPAVLASYADYFRGGNPDRWLFASASTNTIAALAPQLDLMVVRDATGISHNLRTVVVDPQGRIARQLDGNRWTPEQLATAIQAAASGPANRPPL